MDAINLLLEARKAQQYSYSPYSKFSVGAAILSQSGKVFTGTNIENTSYGLSICAERVALFKAVSEGETDLAAIAISSSGSDYIYPCGACLQVLAQFNSQIKIIVSNNDNEIKQYILADLLPQAFMLRAQED